MINKTMIARSSDRVIHYIGQYVQLMGSEKREEVLTLFDNMHQLFPHWVIMTCPVMHPQLRYASKNSQYVFGYGKDPETNILSTENFFTHVHESDQEDLFRCFTYMHDFLETIPPEQHHSFRTVLQYRFRKSNGQYMHLHDEKASLNLPGSGNLYYSLFRDISSERTFTGVKAELFKEDQGLVKIKEFKPSRQNSLSKREAELVTLIRQGLSTKEIAWHLNISHNTVRNIKSNLFIKYKVNNTIELLNMTG